MERLVSWAGRKVLIKAVAQAIPSYAMSVFSFTKDLCGTIQATINRFWWVHKHEGRKLHWLGRSKLCRSKLDGGMGFRDMGSFNKALLAKQLWRLISHPSSLVSRVLGAKYFPHGSVLDATVGPRPNYKWRSIWGVKDVVVVGTRWIVGNGNQIDIWDSRWLPRPKSFAVITARPPNLSVTKVRDLINFSNSTWREDLIRAIFIPYDTELILSLPLCDQWPQDKLI